MSIFPTANHLASWAGLCPGNDESAGKRRSGRTRKGDRYLRRTLVQNARAVAHAKDSFLTSLFWRIARHRGMKKSRAGGSPSHWPTIFCAREWCIGNSARTTMTGSTRCEPRAA